MNPTGALFVIPSCLAVGEEFRLKIKLLGPITRIPCRGQFDTVKPRLRGPFNLNVERSIQYIDNCLREWQGNLTVEEDAALSGERSLLFDGTHQGVFPGDTRPIRSFGGFRWTAPGIHFLRIVDPETGGVYSSNPVMVTADPPAKRIYWGDPHWQSFFSDGIRCPEELYAFARDEAFLDFGAASDHVEALTDRQWDYFTAVTNDYNQPGRFATLVGLEWTNHECGHRNVYYRGNRGPILRCNDPKFETLDQLWKGLEGLEAIAIPHHTANKVMGADWSLGWNPRYEKAVEIYSCWGNSECPAEQGNTRPIRFLGGEVAGQHVIDALEAGFRFGFVGGGDIHDGRPGDDLHSSNDAEGYDLTRPQGFTAVSVPELTRECVYDAIKIRQTYATTKSRIFLENVMAEDKRHLDICAASEEGLEEIVVIRNGEVSSRHTPVGDERVIQVRAAIEPLAGEDFAYVRVRTRQDNYAWASPCWGSSG